MFRTRRQLRRRSWRRTEWRRRWRIGAGVGFGRRAECFELGAGDLLGKGTLKTDGQCLVALLGLSWYKGWFAGVADKLGDLTSSRARTGMGSGTMAPTAPLGSLASSDAQLTTNYQAPTPTPA